MTESTKCRKKMKLFNLRFLRVSLKYRPEILKLIMNMRQRIMNKSTQLKQLKLLLKKMQKQITTEDTSTQTDEVSGCLTDITEKISLITKEISDVDVSSKTINTEDSNISKTKTENLQQKSKQNTEAGWNTEESKGEKSIEEQVREVAQCAMQQTGMVYVESVGMYYDYKTGYYYNSELGLYYHTDTDCYYYYSEEKQTFVFHSYPDRSVQNKALAAHEKKKAKKHKMEKKKEDDIENLTKNLSQENEHEEHSKPKRKKKIPKKKEIHKDENVDIKYDANVDHKDETDIVNKDKQEAKENSDIGKEIEDGECSETSSESDNEDDESNASTSTASDDDSIVKQHPPCMRVIVRETNLPRLKVGSLFLVTKDGGTIGREGEHHTIIIRDHNVSRNHLDIKYDLIKKIYTATDLGSKNGTVLNGMRMSESQAVSSPMEVMHGSTMQLGETKLLCHIHPGNDTCGHCEPGLLMEIEDKDKKVAYTRTCSVQKQHQLELARLKNKYAPKPLSIEATAYNDRAQARRDTVGSSHHAEKTQTSDLDTFIEPENKGFKLLEKMGWSKGEGLGKDNQGDTEPVPLITNDGKAGLGSAGATSTVNTLGPTKVTVNSLGKATLRLANKTKMLNPPAKAFQDPVDDELSE